MSFFFLKDLASEMGLHPRQVKRWTKKLNVPPTVPSQPAHRWNQRDKDKLLNRWRDYWRERQRTVQRLQARQRRGLPLTKAQTSTIGTFFSSSKRG